MHLKLTTDIGLHAAARHRFAVLPSFGKLLILTKQNLIDTSSQNINIADYYFGFLKNLNQDSKLDLISKLSQSLKKENNIPDTSLQSLFGIYKSEETADEMIAEIRNSRVFNRNIEPL